jgi:hypothetical protein
MAGYPAKSTATIRAEITGAPGQAARIIRSVMYRLMRLPEPAAEPVVTPVANPEPVLIPGPGVTTASLTQEGPWRGWRESTPC